MIRDVEPFLRLFSDRQTIQCFGLYELDWGVKVIQIEMLIMVLSLWAIIDSIFKGKGRFGCL